MNAKPIIIAILGACGLSTNTVEPEGPGTAEPIPDAQEDQHFCCESVGSNRGGNATGNGCITIDSTHFASCTTVLFCGGTFTNDGGKVTCFG